MSWQNYTLKPEAAAQRIQRAEQATQAQMMAMRPYGSVHVSASAGTGKTYVLTRRFLRLLLEDTTLRPSEILAVTYTKAGATEMHNRLTEILAKWAVASDSALQAELTHILEKSPSEHLCQHARCLFTAVLDDPVGIRVMTVHGFCQSLLAQFPLEAGISAGFKILEGREAEALLQEKTSETLAHVADWAPENTPYWWAFSHMVTHLADTILQKEFKDFIGNRRRYQKLFEHNGGLEGVLHNLADALGISSPIPKTAEKTLPPHLFLENLKAQHIEELQSHQGVLTAFAEGLAQETGVIAQGDRENLRTFLSAARTPEKLRALPNLLDVFLTKKGEKKAKFVPAKLAKENPTLVDQVNDVYEVLARQLDVQNKYKTFFKTASYLAISHQISTRYTEAKNLRGYLDFEDLVRHTKALLEGEAGKAAWVRFKLDGRINHIMLDEAQDTDSDQWDIVRALIDDFFTGAGQHEAEQMNRTFFAVGDGKQAIYRFRGAERHVFENMLPTITDMATAGNHQVQFVDLNTSFRSSEVILSFVDHVFSSPQNRQAIDGQTTPLRHESFHVGAGGCVEIYPLEPSRAINRDNTFGWHLPLPERGVREEATPRKTLFNKLAKRVHNMIETPPFLATEGRFLVASDIMVLCRSGLHIETFLEALAQQGVKSSKTGDLELAEAPAVGDLISVLRFLANPMDNLSLLHALRSPLFGLQEEELQLLYRQQKEASGKGYFQALLQATSPRLQEMAKKLKVLLNQVDLATPHQLLRCLISLTQGRGQLLWRYTGAVESAAAQTISQALDSFLDAALDYSGQEGASVIGFLHWFDRGGLSVKIEGGSNKEAVRVMTAHASKGLQAPVVIIPEAASGFYTTMSKDHKLWQVNTATHQDELFLFGASQHQSTELQNQLHKAEEKRVFDDEMRLLYVALTRAQEHLIIGGTEQRAKQHNWYMQINECMQEGEISWQKNDDGTRVFKKEHLFTDAPLQADVPTDLPPKKDSLPDWVQEMPPKEHRQTEGVASQNPQTENRAEHLLEGDVRQKFRRGLLLHRLLEVLPSLPDEATRREQGMNFLTYSGQDFTRSRQEDILTDALNVLRHYPELYDEGYQPEATLAMQSDEAGQLKGRVDCLRVTPQFVYIIDYKTDITPPEKIPSPYRKQLDTYAIMAKSIWPDRKIKSGILWTSATPPRLDWVGD